ncbi:hypothetical protein YB2330_002245 [Saitoella coloradoensis]
MSLSKWIKGSSDSAAPNGTFVADDGSATPAHVWATQAFRRGLFGRAASNDQSDGDSDAQETPVPARRTRSDSTATRFDADGDVLMEPATPARPTSSSARTPGILRTPGTIGPKKTVSWNNEKDEKQKRQEAGSPLSKYKIPGTVTKRSGLPRDFPGKFPTPAPAKTVNIPIVQASKPAVSSRLQNEVVFSPNSSVNESAHVELKQEDTDRDISDALRTLMENNRLLKELMEAHEDEVMNDYAEKSMTADGDVTVDMNSPKSGSGKYWKSQFDLLDSMRTQLQKEKELCDHVIKKLETQTQATEQLPLGFSSENMRLKDEIRKIVHDKDLAERQVMELEERLRRVRLPQSEQQTILAEPNPQVEELQQQLAEMSEQVQTAFEMLEVKEKQRQEAVTCHQDELRQYEREKRIADRRICDLEKELHAARNAPTFASPEKNNQLEMLYKEARNQVKKLKEDMKELRMYKIEAEAGKRQYEMDLADIEKYRREARAWENKYRDQEQDVKRLQQELDKSAGVVQRQLDEVRDERSDLRNQLERTRQDSERRVLQFETELKELREGLHKARNEAINTARVFSEVRAERDELRAALKESRSTASRQLRELNEQKRNVEQLENRVQDLKKKSEEIVPLEGVKHGHNLQAEELAAAQRRVRSLEKEKEATDAQIEVFRKEVAELRNAAAAIKTETPRMSSTPGARLGRTSSSGISPAYAASVRRSNIPVVSPVVTASRSRFSRPSTTTVKPEWDSTTSPAADVSTYPARQLQESNRQTSTKITANGRTLTMTKAKDLTPRRRAAAAARIAELRAKKALTSAGTGEDKSTVYMR